LRVPAPSFILGSKLPLAVPLAALLNTAAAAVGSWSGELGLASAGIERGLRLYNTPVLQAGLSYYEARGWQAGVALGVPVHQPSAGLVVLRGGRGWNLTDDWRAQATLQYFGYPGDAAVRMFDRTEAGVEVGFRDLLAVGVSAIRRRHDGTPLSAHLRWDGEASLRWPLAPTWSLSTGLGATDQIGEAGHYYRYGHAGLAWQSGAWRADFVRIATSGAAHPTWLQSIASPRWVGSVGWRF
jgi:hypothetical protein